MTSIDPRTAATWLKAWRRGRTYRAIADAAGDVSESTVRRTLQAMPGWQPRRSGPPKRVKVTAEMVVAAWEQLRSIRGVETHLGVSETLVRARLAEAGLIEHPDKRPRKRDAS